MLVTEIIRSAEIDKDENRVRELTHEYASKVTPTEHKLGGFTIYEIRSNGKIGSRVPLMLFIGEQDPKSNVPQLYGQLALVKYPHQGKDFVFSEVYFDPKIQGKGLAVPLYKLAIQHYGFTIVSDESQTKGSESLWTKLAKDPSVHVYAWDQDEDTYRAFDPTDPDDVYYDPKEMNALKQEAENVKDKLQQQYMDGEIDEDEYGELLSTYLNPLYDEIEAMARAQDVRLVATAKRKTVAEGLITEKPVLSSWITHIVLQRNKRDVTVTLNNGRKYQVAGLGRKLYSNWINSESKGQFWHKFVKGNYTVTRIM